MYLWLDQNSSWFQVLKLNDEHFGRYGIRYKFVSFIFSAFSGIEYKFTFY